MIPDLERRESAPAGSPQVYRCPLSLSLSLAWHSRVCIEILTLVVLCDAIGPDLPIVYCSHSFEVMIGYAREAVLGRNYRFLQSRASEYAASNRFDEDSRRSESSVFQFIDENQRASQKMLRDSVRSMTERQVVIRNFTKDGIAFLN